MGQPIRIRSAMASIVVCVLSALAPNATHADDTVRAEIDPNGIAESLGLDGSGVVVAIIDRGIDYEHPDFINDDGTTRILAILDMTGQNGCPSSVTPTEFTRTQINQALASGVRLDTRDAVGHGTVTAGLAAGDGSASPGRRFRGVAPGANLLIVKAASEGAPAHDGEPAEAAFVACLDEALDWVDQKLIELGNPPCVGLINSGTQWGPIDGTSAVSRKIDEVFGLDRPGRVYVAASGDEGSFPTHARVVAQDGSPASVRFRMLGSTQFLGFWASGDDADITIEYDSGPGTPPIRPGESYFGGIGIDVVRYEPGGEFYPWTSDSGDQATWVRLNARSGTGTITFSNGADDSTTIDLFASDLAGNFRFLDSVVPGRLTDYAATRSALSVGCHVARTTWVDINGIQRTSTSEGLTGELWAFSSPGPTRDGRRGVAISAPGHNAFAAYAPRSWWAEFRSNINQDGAGLYGRAFATSASAPIVMGSVALMLELNPALTARRAIEIIESTARADDETGAVQNPTWGGGQLDLGAALLAVLDPACAADLTGDGDLDFFDVSAFLSAFGAEDPVADFTDDGMFDFFDVSAFLNAFGAGCP